MKGPYGGEDGIGEAFIAQLAKRDNLLIQGNAQYSGLLTDFGQLNMEDANRLSPKVRHFYVQTASYSFDFRVKCNPFFRPFGYMLNRIFSARIKQLHIPLRNAKTEGRLFSELITLSCAATGAHRHTIWLRKFVQSDCEIYSGIYTQATLPSSTVCSKAIFPLPHGNATVLLEPFVGAEGKLILRSSGKRFGDAGFYFLLEDQNHAEWAKYIPAFTVELVVWEKGDELESIQTLKLWGLPVLCFYYQIRELSIVKGS